MMSTEKVEHEIRSDGVAAEQDVQETASDNRFTGVAVEEAPAPDATPALPSAALPKAPDATAPRFVEVEGLATPVPIAPASHCFAKKIEVSPKSLKAILAIAHRDRNTVEIGKNQQESDLLNNLAALCAPIRSYLTQVRLAEGFLSKRQIHCQDVVPYRSLQHFATSMLAQARHVYGLDSQRQTRAGLWGNYQAKIVVPDACKGSSVFSPAARNITSYRPRPNKPDQLYQVLCYRLPSDGAKMFGVVESVYRGALTRERPAEADNAAHAPAAAAPAAPGPTTGTEAHAPAPAAPAAPAPAATANAKKEKAKLTRRLRVTKPVATPLTPCLASVLHIIDLCVASEDKPNVYTANCVGGGRVLDPIGVVLYEVPYAKTWETAMTVNFEFEQHVLDAACRSEPRFNMDIFSAGAPFVFKYVLCVV